MRLSLGIPSSDMRHSANVNLVKTGEAYEPSTDRPSGVQPLGSNTDSLLHPPTMRSGPPIWRTARAHSPGAGTSGPLDRTYARVVPSGDQAPGRAFTANSSRIPASISMIHKSNPAFPARVIE